MLLLALVGLTAALLVLDVAGWSGASALRAGGATVFGPLERLVASRADDRAADRVRVRAAQAADARSLEESRQLSALLGAPATAGRRLVAARVVAVGAQGPSGPERVTIDAGTRDGVTRDLAVVNADGLVGRVVAAAPWTADVLVLGSADLVVGVRAGRGGALGAVGVARPGVPVGAGQVALSLVRQGAVAPGDAVTTLGSVDGRPFPPGVPVGTVRSVHTRGAGTGTTAAVSPAADRASLDVVGVLLPGPRLTPRPAATGGRG